MKLVAVLADGAEELEAVGVIDTLRRSGATVTAAGLTSLEVRGAHGMRLGCDVLFRQCDAAACDAVFLPGGLNGALALYNSNEVAAFLEAMNREHKVISAICAAPIVLAKAGLLDGRTFTMYPGFEQYLHGLAPTGALAETDGKIVTGKGPGAIFAFSQALAAALGLREGFAAAARGMFLPL